MPEGWACGSHACGEAVGAGALCSAPGPVRHLIRKMGLGLGGGWGAGRGRGVGIKRKKASSKRHTPGASSVSEKLRRKMVLCRGLGEPTSAHPHRPHWMDCGPTAHPPPVWSNLTKSSGQVRSYLNTQTLKAGTENSCA